MRQGVMSIARPCEPSCETWSRGCGAYPSPRRRSAASALAAGGARTRPLEPPGRLSLVAIEGAQCVEPGPPGAVVRECLARAWIGAAGIAVRPPAGSLTCTAIRRTTIERGTEHEPRRTNTETGGQGHLRPEEAPPTCSQAPGTNDYR